MEAVELIFTDIEYDTGYGVQVGDLYVDVTPKVEQANFGAYGVGGELRTVEQREGVVGFSVEGEATLFLVGNNGEELGEVNIDSESLKAYVSDGEIMEALEQEVCGA